MSDNTAKELEEKVKNLTKKLAEEMASNHILSHKILDLEEKLERYESSSS